MWIRLDPQELPQLEEDCFQPAQMLYTLTLRFAEPLYAKSVVSNIARAHGEVQKINIWAIVYTAFKGRTLLNFVHRGNLRGLTFGRCLTNIV